MGPKTAASEAKICRQTLKGAFDVPLNVTVSEIMQKYSHCNVQTPTPYSTSRLVAACSKQTLAVGPGLHNSLNCCMSMHSGYSSYFGDKELTDKFDAAVTMLGGPAKAKASAIDKIMADNKVSSSQITNRLTRLREVLKDEE